jgi:intracellular sulfur oxidation DsrE/DsrF family protein
MSHKSLAEAAAEVLNKSRADSVHEPMHSEPEQPASSGKVDLGGVTYEDPEATHVGQITAAHRTQAEKPGVQPAEDSEEAMKKLPTQPGQTAGRPLAAPPALSGPGVSTAGYEYAHPTTEEIEGDFELTEEELEEAKKAKMEKWKEKMKGKDCKEDVAAILSGESLSEEFKTKLTTIFEAAVIARAVMVAEEMEEEILAAAEESVDEIKTELEEQVDAYLTTMVEEWKAENQLAVESGLRSEIVEEFLDGLKSLFQEHYIELPSEKVDVVEALTAEVAELTEKLNNSMNSNVDLQIKINEATKNQITGRVCEGLTATQAAKVKTLAEGVEFVTADDYTKKLQVIREGYFSSGTVKQVQPANAIALTESEVPAQDEEEISSSMARYVEAIGRTQ